MSSSTFQSSKILLDTISPLVSNGCSDETRRSRVKHAFQQLNLSAGLVCPCLDLISVNAGTHHGKAIAIFKLPTIQNNSNSSSSNAKNYVASSTELIVDESMNTSPVVITVRVVGSKNSSSEDGRDTAGDKWM